MKTKQLFLPILIGLSLLCVRCTNTAFNKGIKEPSDFTKAYNANYSERLNWADTSDYVNASRGFLAGPKDSVILTESGDTVWNFKTWRFLSDPNTPSPSTVNPSLWRQENLAAKAGLFEVQKDRIYQIRNFDLAVMSFVIGDNGYIIIDPLGSPYTAKAGHDLFKATIPESTRKTLKAVIYTHSHIDHFAGIDGVYQPKKGIELYAPSGFMEEAVSENVYAGNVMGQRANFMYGDLLPRNVKQSIGAGLGMATSSGVKSIYKETKTIDDSTPPIDNLAGTGLAVEFLFAPHTEAPSEMLFYFPQLKALCAAEDASHTLHNLYSLRGAKTRSARDWVAALTSVLKKWGNDVEVEFNSHHWPVWSNDTIKTHLETQRAMYKFIHDQTLHLANMGYDMTTSAEIISHLPESLNRVWSSQGYYGSVNHNVKATWNLYLGWFNGNPSQLHKLPDVSPDTPFGNSNGTPLKGGSAKYVDYMGGKRNVVIKAKEDFKKGEYRWVAEVLQHVVNIDSSDREARYLLADALEQMGYQAVSGPWRNFYLTGAMELRNGRSSLKTSTQDMMPVLANMSSDQIFDYLSILVDPYKADGKKINFAFVVKEGSATETMTYQLNYSCLNYLVDKTAPLDFTVTINKQELKNILKLPDPMNALIKLAESGQSPIEVNPKIKGLLKLKELGSVISAPAGVFNIVTPNLPMPKPINPMKVQQW